MKVLVVTNMYPNLSQPAFGTFVKDQVEALRQAGVEIDVLFVNGRKNKLNYFWGIFRFWWMLLKKRYNLIHAHHAISGLLARLQFLYPVVVTYHGGEVQQFVASWLRFLSRRGAHIFDRVIVVNRREQEVLGDDAKVRVIPCGVNLDEFKPIPRDEARRRLGLPRDRFLVLWAGEYWQPEKHFELAKASMRLVQQRYPEAEFVLVSGRPHSEIPLYMSACDALLLTSISEGSPMVIKEAMACNLPIVSTNVGDVAEVIGSEEGCHLSEPNAEDIAGKLILVLQRLQRTNGRNKMNDLGSGLISRRIIRVYNEVCPSVGQMTFPDGDKR